MPRYSFYQDTKVETWERSHFDVTANSCEEAVAIVKAFKDSDVDNHQDEEYLSLIHISRLYENASDVFVAPIYAATSTETFAPSGIEYSSKSKDRDSGLA